MTILQQERRSHFGAVRYDVVASGRPWWQVRYVDGHELAEWETPPGIVTKHAKPLAGLWRSTRWEEVPKRGIIGMRLLCPNGMVGELETNNPMGRFIELKIGGQDIPIMGGPVQRYMTANMIGCVEDDGSVQCWSYERNPHPIALDLETLRCVTCNLPRHECSGRDVTVSRHDELRETVPDPAWPERTTRERVFIDTLHGSIVPLISFTDNVHNMAYHRLGPLRLDVQGLAL